METITKKELTIRTAIAVDVTVAEAKRVVDEFISQLAGAIGQGDTIVLRGLATIKPVTRKAKPARNIKTGETIHVPEHKVVKAAFSPALLAELNRE